MLALAALRAEHIPSISKGFKMVLQMVVVVRKNMKLTHFFTLNNYFSASLPYPGGVLALGLPLAVVDPGRGPDGLLLYSEA